MGARLALFGQPVAHSISPWLHRQFANACGMEVRFDRIETAPGALAAGLEQFAGAGGIGANVTLPLKGEALGACEKVSERARRAGAVNTVKRTETGWFGDNTDGAGFIMDLTRNLRFDPAGRRVLIAGAGGAARGILPPLLDITPGALFIANRDAGAAQRLAKACADPRAAGCGFAVLADTDPFDLVINATAAGHSGQRPALPAQVFAPDSLAIDLTYGEAAGPFVQWARRAGAARVADGRGMLVEQGALSFELWFGVKPDTAGIIEKLPS